MKEMSFSELSSTDVN